VWTPEQLNTLADNKPRQLVPIVLDLQTLVATLQARPTLNSQNSSKPPSSDGYAKPAPKSLRTSTGRKSGGQPGHPGRTLEPVERADHTVTIPLDLCPNGCGTKLHAQTPTSHQSRQVFDLPPQKLEVTEYRAETKHCPACNADVSASFPAAVTAPVQYGKRFLAFLTYLRNRQFIASDRVSQFCTDIYGYAVGEQTIQDAETTIYENLAGFALRIKELLPCAKILNGDETGLRVEGKLHWVHGLGSSLLTWYGLHPRKGFQAMKDFGILVHFKGRLIHDCLWGYFEWPCLHGLCNAHLVRELNFIFETFHQDWAEKMRRILLDMNERVNELKLLGRIRLSHTELASWIKRYEALLAAGYAANPPPPLSRVPRRGRQKKTKAINLLDRMSRHQQWVLAFLHDFSVPFTNNHAEQILRMLKVRQKISGCFRTAVGAERFLRVRSYIDTVRKNDRPIFQALVDAATGRPFIPSSAA
jgi:transposase